MQSRYKSGSGSRSRVRPNNNSGLANNWLMWSMLGSAPPAPERRPGLSSATVYGAESLKSSHLSEKMERILEKMEEKGIVVTEASKKHSKPWDNDDDDGSSTDSSKDYDYTNLAPSECYQFALVSSQAYVTREVMEHQYKGSGTRKDPYQVEFLENDPRNPKSFSSSKKALYTVIVSMAVLAISVNSAAYTGATEQVMDEFGNSMEVGILGVSMFLLGFAAGPLLWAPISELYGRQIVFIGTFSVLTIFSAGAAGSPNVAGLIIMRFISAVFGSSQMTNAGGNIADMYDGKTRGAAMTVFAASPFMGPAIGPIIGGFVGQSIGWRWVQGLQAIFCGTVCIVGTIFVPETYAPVLLQKRAKELSARTGKVYASKLECGPHGHRKTPQEAFSNAMIRPWALLVREPIVLSLTIYMGIIYGTLFMLLDAFPIVFQKGRGWSQGIGGLAFVGLMVGFMIAAALLIVDNKRYVKVTERYEEKGEMCPPETRLPPAILGSVLVPAGLFWFAWTNQPPIHWSVSIIGTAPFGMGMLLVFVPIMNYLLDAYTIYAASVLAANSSLRFFCGFVFPLFTTYMYQGLGNQWASSIPAFLAVGCVPFPFLFYKHGPKIRKKCKYAKEAMDTLKRIQSQNQDEESHSDSDTEYEKEDHPDRDMEKGYKVSYKERGTGNDYKRRNEDKVHRRTSVKHQEKDYGQNQRRDHGQDNRRKDTKHVEQGRGRNERNDHEQAHRQRNGREQEHGDRKGQERYQEQHDRPRERRHQENSRRPGEERHSRGPPAYEDQEPRSNEVNPKVKWFEEQRDRIERINRVRDMQHGGWNGSETEFEKEARAEKYKEPEHKRDDNKDRGIRHRRREPHDREMVRDHGMANDREIARDRENTHHWSVRPAEAESWRQKYEELEKKQRDIQKELDDARRERYENVHGRPAPRSGPEIPPKQPPKPPPKPPSKPPSKPLSKPESRPGPKLYGSDLREEWYAERDRRVKEWSRRHARPPQQDFDPRKNLDRNDSAMHGSERPR